MMPGPEGRLAASVRLSVAVPEGCLLINALRDAARSSLRVQALPGGELPEPWCNLVRGTALDPGKRPSNGLVEQPQEGEGPFQEEWSFEDEHGRPLFEPFCCADRWERPPYSMSLYLVAHRQAERFILEQACVGTRGPYNAFIEKLADTSVMLLKKFLATPSEDPPSLEARFPGPGAPAFTDFLAGRKRHFWARMHERLHSETWGIGVSERSFQQILRSGELGPVRWIDGGARADYFADPFPWPGCDDRILCERWNVERGLGEIVAIRDDDTRAFEKIELPLVGHLSYPYAWQEAGTVFLLPESGAARCTALFRLDPQGCVERLVTIAEGESMADPTLFKWDGHYWIAYTDTSIGWHDNLCLMYAERLEGPWRPHLANPVKIDVRSSRPGGTPVLVDGSWYRPAQDCAEGYGNALAINRILELAPNRFKEEVVAVLRPDPQGPYPDGLHTLSTWGDRVLIDGKKWRLSPAAMLRKARRRFSAALGRPAP